MNERLPYEEQLCQQWNNLPLPDENMAWADMKRWLEEDDDKPLVPFWLRGCAGWGLLGILLLGLGWWFIRPDKWFNKKQEQIQVNETINDYKKIKKDTATYFDDSTGISKVGTVIIEKDSGDLIIDEIPTDGVQIEGGEKGKKKLVTDKDKKEETGYSKMNGEKKKKIEKIVPLVIKNKPEKVIKSNNNDKEYGDTSKTITKTKPLIIDSATLIKPVNTEPVGDSAKLIKKDSLDKKEVVANPVSKENSSKKKSFTFSAGIALQQQLPVAGQNFIPYNAQGRKGSLRDYIPSVYVRLNREDKWFIQSGFRYGAPQLVKEFFYSSKIDTTNPQKIVTTSTQLKKTFYHQLPVTFNYFVLPNFSLGGGVVWNRFGSAVSTKDIIQRDRFTGIDSTLSAAVIVNSRKADSNFIKSYFQATIETQYKWKRFSFGANYSFGLQPYIRFSLPGGQTQEQKNKSLQLFIRYELWKSKGK